MNNQPRRIKKLIHKIRDIYIYVYTDFFLLIACAIFVLRSVKNPAEFWGEIAKEFYWETPAAEDKFFSYNFDLKKGDIFIRWMEGASTNISFNLLDKNVKSGNGDKIAFYW